MKPFVPQILGTLSANALSRRTFLRSAALAAGGATLPMGRRARAEAEMPHFFLFLCVSGGMDASYLFDARPLVMTDKNRITNYLYKNPRADQLAVDPTPRLLTGSNGGTLLRTELTDPLMAYQSDFSVLNGVCMLTNGFVGHGNNMYYLFTNSANPGRDSFVPMIGARGKRPLDSIHIGGFEGDGNGAPTNFSSSIQLFPGQGGNLANALTAGPKLDLESALMKQVMARLAANAQGTGKFSIGSGKMESGIAKGPALAETLKNVAASSNNGNPVMGALDIAMGYFKGGVTTAATIMYDRDPVLDVHDSGGAQNQPTLFKEVVANLAQTFERLKTTPFDAERGLSFLDVTTLVITSEFSRTMMGTGSTADTTGTEHNPLTNTVIVAGKGIKGGQVFGASDLTNVNEAGDLVDVSEAHRQVDPGLQSIMGRPFDFASMQPRSDLPTTFNESEYLSIATVANTLMENYGIPSQQQFRVGSVTAPVLKGLLK